MKYRLLLTLLFFSSIVYSQIVIKNPRIGMSTASNVSIEKIELSDTATVLWFHVQQPPGAGIFVPDKSFIQAVGSTEKLFVTAAEGIKINKQFVMPSSGETFYKLYFPRLQASTSTIDFGEDNEGGSWFIYDIQLKLGLVTSVIPPALSGNWFRNDDGQWEISLFDSMAIYKNLIWKYQQYTEKGGLGKISLKNGLKTITLYTKSINDNTCMVGELPSKLIKYTHQPDESAIPADNEPYQLPVFQMDTVTYCGYIKGFSPRFSQRTGRVNVDNILTGNLDSYTIKIADDGSFKLKFAHSNPQGIIVRLPFTYETVHVEPGKTTFHLIDIDNKTNLFMGDCARINTDLFKLKHINNPFHYLTLIMENALNFSPEQYKAWIQEQQQKEQQALADFGKSHSLSIKAVQVKRLDIDYWYSSNIFEYGSFLEYVWRKKNNIPRDQEEISFKPAKPDSSYYNFLTNELLNNPMAVLTSEYSTFINRVQYMDILKNSYSTLEIMDEMEKTGIALTSKEKDLVVRLKWSDKYGPQWNAFYLKYADKLNALSKEKQGIPVSPEMIEEYLTGQNIEVTAEEKAMLIAQKEWNENPQLHSHNDDITADDFNKNHKDFINELFTKNNISARNKKIQKIFGIQLGIATDIMCSQNICRPIVSEMAPLSNEKLLAAQKEITTPFIADYIALKNNEIKAKLEANKKMAGAKVNEVPKTDGDKLFDAIMEKYKGKVVYVDFWATWCAPCRSGIEQIKPLKEEMEKENVVFVYISDPTSPKATYDNMIPTIRGEHYRASQDEWNTLCGKFNISGIPHCVLVGKNGKVINAHLPYMENEQLKTMLMKYINE